MWPGVLSGSGTILGLLLRVRIELIYSRMLPTWESQLVHELPEVLHTALQTCVQEEYYLEVCVDWKLQQVKEYNLGSEYY